MVLFTCPRCLYSTGKKSNIINHVNRNKLCKLNNLDIIPKDYEDIILENNELYLKLLTKNCQLEKELSEAKKEIKKLTINGDHNHVGDNNTDSHNVTINNNNTINISLTDYNKPNVDFITRDLINNLLKNTETTLGKLFQKIYLNPDHPENHSIKKTSYQNNVISVHENFIWNIKMQDDIYPSIKDELYGTVDMNCDSDDERKYDLLDEKIIKKSEKDIFTRCRNFTKSS